MIEEMELPGFQDKDEGRIQEEYNREDELQKIKDNLNNGIKEIKGMAQGLWEWKH